MGHECGVKDFSAENQVKAIKCSLAIETLGFDKLRRSRVGKIALRCENFSRIYYARIDSKEILKLSVCNKSFDS